MKKIIAFMLTTAMIITTVFCFAFTTSATESNNIKGVIPRVNSDITLDGKANEEFWLSAYQETLNEENAVIKDTSLDEDPTEDLPSLLIKMAYYSEFEEGTDPSDMSYSADPNGGLLLYMEVKDYHKAFAFGETEVDYISGDSFFNGNNRANSTDCVQIAFDPFDNNQTIAGLNGESIFSFVPYSIVSPDGTTSSPMGSGSVAGGRGWWWQHWGGGIGYGDSYEYLLQNSVEMAAITDYKFNPDHQLPDEKITNKAVRRLLIISAYQYADITGYRIEAKMHWNLFDDDAEEYRMGLQPYAGKQFGMVISLVDYTLTDYNVNCADSEAVQEAQKIYRVYLNGGDEDTGWSSIDTPSTWPTYELGDYAKEFVFGDADGNGQVDIKDSMMTFMHVAKKEIIKDTISLRRLDTNNDGVVNVKDSMRIFYYVAKLVDSVEEVVDILA